jgi:MoxR-like ATPase
MDLDAALRAADYVPRVAELIALRSVQAARPNGIRAVLLEGPAGAGKTALSEAYARATGARYVYALLHCWSDDQDLFRGVDVVAAVSGDAAHVEQPGVLAVAAEASQAGPTVLCLDEIDKCHERTEGLLLDVLQSGRVPVRPGKQLEARKEHLVVFITSNGTRPLGDALLRRVRRVRMQPLAVDVLDRLAAERSGAPVGVVKHASRAARAVAAAEGNHALSVQEIAHFAGDAWRVAESVEDVRELLGQWAVRTEIGVVAARQAQLAPFWGEIVAARRRR